MEISHAVRALAALAQESRLAVFRALARAGPAGVPAGELAEGLDIPASTLSFHLRHLAAAGLVRAERRSRSLLYSLRSDALNELLWFLGEDCCQGRTALCAGPTARIEQQRRDSVAAAEPPRVLFVCSGNSARSQMAEAILRRDAGDRLLAASAGIAPCDVDPLTREVLKEIEIDPAPLVAKDLGAFLGKVPIHYAIVVCEAANAHCPEMVPFALHTLYWPFPDPVAAPDDAHAGIDAFRAVRDAIAARIERWLEERPWELREARAPRRAGTGG